jgi:hypothetical protein
MDQHAATSTMGCANPPPKLEPGLELKLGLELINPNFFIFQNPGGFVVEELDAIGRKF